MNRTEEVQRVALRAEKIGNALNELEREGVKVDELPCLYELIREDIAAMAKCLEGIATKNKEEEQR